MPKITNYPSFNHEGYVKILRQFINNYEDCLSTKCAENIFKNIRIPLKHDEMSRFLRELWDLFNKSNAIANLDYILKDETYIKKFNISPYLNTKHISSKMILYHGGYSKSLYTSWNNYLKQGKKNLSLRLTKYCALNQHVHSWLTNFNDQLLFFEYNFVKLLKRPLTISLFKKIQLMKI
jgi:sulfur relay (sulfurtransferase) DsrC/TusE family protein